MTVLVMMTGPMAVAVERYGVREFKVLLLWLVQCRRVFVCCVQVESCAILVLSSLEQTEQWYLDYICFCTEQPHGSLYLELDATYKTDIPGERRVWRMDEGERCYTIC